MLWNIHQQVERGFIHVSKHSKMAVPIAPSWDFKITMVPNKAQKWPDCLSVWPSSQRLNRNQREFQVSWLVQCHWGKPSQVPQPTYSWKRLSSQLRNLTKRSPVQPEQMIFWKNLNDTKYAHVNMPHKSATFLSIKEGGKVGVGVKGRLKYFPKISVLIGHCFLLG